jgi:prepilin-type N-terminal cleavage/methylation domain-containing protein
MRVRERKAFTLIELLIVVAVIGIVSAVGYTQMSVLRPRYRAYKAARDFAANIQLIRQHAATDGIEYRIALVSFDPAWNEPETDNVGAYYVQAGNRESGSTRWEMLPTDAVKDGSDDETGQGTVNLNPDLADVSIMPWQTINGPSYGGSPNTDCIVISPRGWLVNPNEDFDETGHIVVQFINKASQLRGGSEIYDVRIARSGMVRVDLNQSHYGSVADSPQGIDEGSSTSSTSSGPS